jgi:hypothetical protein
VEEAFALLTLIVGVVGVRAVWEPGVRGHRSSEHLEGVVI